MDRESIFRSHGKQIYCLISVPNAYLTNTNIICMFLFNSADDLLVSLTQQLIWVNRCHHSLCIQLIDAHWLKQSNRSIQVSDTCSAPQLPPWNSHFPGFSSAFDNYFISQTGMPGIVTPHSFPLFMQCTYFEVLVRSIFCICITETTEIIQCTCYSPRLSLFIDLPPPDLTVLLSEVKLLSQDLLLS